MFQDYERLPHVLLERETRGERLDQIAKQIKESTNLWDSHSSLIEFEDACDETWPDEEDEIKMANTSNWTSKTRCATAV
jgi:hypothetical protein